jgi:uracil-DNA glycosylase
MAKRPQKDAAELIPNRATLNSVRAASKHCRACELWKRGTQTVFGEGIHSAELMFVGEQPGDVEDLAGRPFVGPAGKLLDRVLDAVGIDRATVYVTNVVKHFKWEPRGKRRIHKKPRISEIKACRPWLEAELRAVKPQIVVLLGATAAQSIMGSQFKLMQNRGKVLQTPGPVGRDLPVERVVATIHPSAVLRAPDSEGRRAAYESLVADLKVVARALRAGS